MSVRQEIYWAAQGALGALLLLSLLIPVPWQLPWGIVGVAQCYLIPSRLNDAGRKPWLPLVAIAPAAIAISALGAWAVREDLQVGGDGAGLIYAGASVCLVIIVGAALIIWPGLLRSRPRGAS